MSKISEKGERNSYCDSLAYIKVRLRVRVRGRLCVGLRLTFSFKAKFCLRLGFRITLESVLSL